MKQISNSVKLTGKNQLTVPAKIARQLGVQAGDHLQYELKSGALVLRPRPSIEHRMRSVWEGNAKINKGAASDASIKQTLRQHHAGQTKRP